MQRTANLLSIIIATLALWCATTASLATQDQVQNDRRVVPPQINDADGLLRALERADRGLRTFSADVQYVRRFGAIEGDAMQVRRGKLYYQAETEEAPDRFAVRFDTLFVDRRKFEEDKTFIFDGQWLVEQIARDRLVIRRQIVPPGQRIDPLRIGEGPLPIPIGQERAEILRRFTAELRPAEETITNERQREMMRDTWQLRLVPRPGTEEARQFREVRLWYLKSNLLPRYARTVSADGGSSDVFLINLQVNQSVPEDVFDAPVPEGWQEQIEPFRGEVGAGAGAKGDDG